MPDPTGKWSSKKGFKPFDGDSGVHALSRESRYERDSYSRGSFADKRRERRPAPYSRREAPAKPITARTTSRSRTVELSNLSDAIEQEDLLEIFEDYADQIKKARINETSDGKPDGTGILMFGTRAQALEAVKEYDRAKVDGRPMYMRLMDEDESTSRFKIEKKARAPAGPVVERAFRTERPSSRAAPSRARDRDPDHDSFEGHTKESIFGAALDELDDPMEYRPRSRNSRSGGFRKSSGGRGRGRGRGRSGGRGRGGRARQPAPSLEAMDAELDAYREKAQQKNE